MLDHARAFEFRSSLVDLPAVSAARALLILCEFPCHWRRFDFPLAIHLN
jgi:hypothetical protein